MLYHLYELNHATVAPLRAAAAFGRQALASPMNPLAATPVGRMAAAGLDVFESVTRRYGKPAFNLPVTEINGEDVPVTEETVWTRTFCNLVRFRRDEAALARLRPKMTDPKVLIVAPMSGHYATLLRGTVEALLPDHDVHITDWADARMVPVSEGSFDLDDYITYVMEMIRHLGGDVHLLAVCQPSVPVLAAVALMSARNDPHVPLSMTLMGGPIDTRENPTEVNNLATERGIDWFTRNVIMTVPFPHPGAMRRVYPGFLQLSGFMSMNLDRHVQAHQQFFQHLVEGDGDSAEKHRAFYDEYLSVMDLTAEFYLQTVDTVFVRHALPRGEMTYHGEPVDPAAITRTALMTVEGEKDDISGIGQTKAAHKLMPNLPDTMKTHYEQPGVGHYGVFNGARWKSEIAPRVAAFMRQHTKRPAAKKNGKAA